MSAFLTVCRIGQNRIFIHTPCMTVYLVISLPKVPCVHRIWFWPTLCMTVILNLTRLQQTKEVHSIQDCVVQAK